MQSTLTFKVFTLSSFHHFHRVVMSVLLASSFIVMLSSWFHHVVIRSLALVFILSVFIWDLQCKSHFNRKMVFRVTKSQYERQMITYLILHDHPDWGVACGGDGGWWVGWGCNIHGFSGGLSANECKYLNERDHKIYTAWQSMGRRVIFFFPTWKTGPGFLWPKEAERGWKSGARPLSWKSRWKPSTREEFWHQRI